MEVWTSNFDQKLQIFEQIASQFNPDMEIQSTDNYLDWTSLSYILLSDTNWTTRSIPVGSDDPIDILTFSFEMPIWITTPAKVRKLGIIQSVVSNIYDAQGNPSLALIEQINNLGNRQYFTPTGYQAIVNNGIVTLIPNHGPEINNSNFNIPTTVGNPIAWAPVIHSFGEIIPNVSLLYLTNAATERLIVGTVAYDLNNPDNLAFTVDPTTIPSNTLPAINAVVDPTVNGPNAGLPAAASGQRYLLVNPIGSTANQTGNSPKLWQNTNGSGVVAQTNDIIQYDGNNWNVSLHPISTTGIQYVTNTFSGIQYVWTGTQWQKSWEGLYQEGLWSIVI
jgi:hypothetical protein